MDYTELLMRGSEEELEKAIRKRWDFTPFKNMAEILSAEERAKILQTGTVIIAFKFNGGVVAASDGRVSGGHGPVYHDAFEKILELDEHGLILISGVAGFCKDLVLTVRVIAENFRKVRGRELSTKGKVKQIARIVKQFLQPAILMQMMVIPMFCSYKSEEGGRVFCFALDGTYIEKDFHTDGSGSLTTAPLLKEFYRPGMTEEEALKLAVKLLKAAIENDGACGGKYFIKIIDENGIRQVPQEQILQVLGG